jgi:hypothetical protein
MVIDPLAVAAETCALLCMVSNGWVRNITFLIHQTHSCICRVIGKLTVEVRTRCGGLMGS